MKPKTKSQKLEKIFGGKVPKKTGREVAIKLGTKLPRAEAPSISLRNYSKTFKKGKTQMKYAHDEETPDPKHKTHKAEDLGDKAKKTTHEPEAKSGKQHQSEAERKRKARQAAPEEGEA